MSTNVNGCNMINEVRLNETRGCNKSKCAAEAMFEKSGKLAATLFLIFARNFSVV